MYKYIFLIIILLLSFSGCGSPFNFRSMDEVKKEILEKDPSFSSALDIRAKLDEQIMVLKTEFNEKKTQLNNKVNELRKELNSTQKDLNNKIKNIESELNPQREELKQKIRGLVTELKLKESSLSATNKTVSKLTKLVQESPVSEDLTKDAPKWQEKTTSLKEQAQEFEKEIASLRDTIRLDRLKLKLLK